MPKRTSPCLSIRLIDNVIHWTKAHQGNLTDQFKKTAASPSKVKSVTTALPSRKKSPPTAGSSARASGAECLGKFRSQNHFLKAKVRVMKRAPREKRPFCFHKTRNNSRFGRKQIIITGGVRTSGTVHDVFPALDLSLLAVGGCLLTI